ncbi:MAG: 3-oxoacyl-[acyl-carrier-protein] reductase [Clostridiales bacterium]|nr:3-oxoacyl-[acyl-carrier-protein] reductase [Clostridiales bacterium]
MLELKGKNVLVTGGSRGIGRAVALLLAKEGANIVINYARSETQAQEVVDEIEKFGVRAIALKANVANAKEVDEMAKIIETELGNIDILVNNAGITKDNLLIRMKEEDWQDVINVNLTGVFICTKAFARKMIKQKYGKIINISSVVAVVGNAGQSNYCASKAGIIGFTKSIARELGGKGICVNAIAPGFIQTDMTSVLPEKVKEDMSKQIPLKRFGTDEDVANLVLFLASEKSNYITGQVIHVDGGMGM